MMVRSLFSVLVSLAAATIGAGWASGSPSTSPHESAAPALASVSALARSPALERGSAGRTALDGAADAALERGSAKTFTSEGGSVASLDAPSATPSSAGSPNPGAPAAILSSAEPALRIPLAHSLLIAPRGCSGVHDRFDVLIHFHGAFTTVEPRLLQSGIDAVYLVQNLGNGSGAYEAAYAGGGALNAQLESIRVALNRRCGGATRSVGRVALSGWSAGYGAIYHILARPADAARVDAVLLADGMHVGFEPGSHRVRAAAMEPYLRFATASARGERLMAVTHSSIVPPGYASTTATADFLVRELDVAPVTATNAEPRPGMHATSNHSRGSLTISGYAGDDAHAHCDHLYAIADTLWSQLRDRWTNH